MSLSKNTIRRALPRDTVQVTLSSHDTLSGEFNNTLEDFFHFAEAEGILKPDAPIVAAICDGRLRELSYKPTRDVTVTPITLASSDGGRIYRRSLIFLLTTAINQLWPGVKVGVHYAVPDGGYFCQLIDHPQLTPIMLNTLEQRMRQLVAANHPIEKRTIPLDEARAYFEARGDLDKARLLRYRNRQDLTLYRLCENEDYYFGYMTPSTGYLKTFKLLHADNGFILQYPRQENPNELGALTAYSKLSTVFRQANEWLERLHLPDVGRLNELVSGDDVQEIILVAEALHEQRIAQIAQSIKHAYEQGRRIVTIAGPSSSGKTTFSKRLAIQLLALGIYPLTIEMDNFFVDREHTPRDVNGDYDFEALHALDLPLLARCVKSLLSGERTQLPKFDFLTGKQSNGQLVTLHDNQLIILEGIHGLNPLLLPDIDAETIYRVYVSALTQLNIDLHNRVPTTDVRLLRRIVRDARARGYNAADTLNRWSSVRQGEKRNIFPFQEHADAIFNSALVYELAALRPFAEPLLLQVKPNTPAHLEANRLLSFLTWVQPFTPQQLAMIPDTSLIREFIGGSVLDNYHPKPPRNAT